jgi:hypothetical protein
MPQVARYALDATLVTVWVYEPLLQLSAWYWAYAWLA